MQPDRNRTGGGAGRPSRDRREMRGPGPWPDARGSPQHGVSVRDREQVEAPVPARACPLRPSARRHRAGGPRSPAGPCVHLRGRLSDGPTPAGRGHTSLDDIRQGRRRDGRPQGPGGTHSARPHQETPSWREPRTASAQAPPQGRLAGSTPRCCCTEPNTTKPPGGRHPEGSEACSQGSSRDKAGEPQRRRRRCWALRLYFSVGVS